MVNTDKYVNRIMTKAIILLAIESIVIFIFFKDFLPIVLGLSLGGSIGLAFFRILYLNILHAIEKTEQQAKRFMTINYIVRYIISGLVLFVAAKSDYLNIFSCFIGLLTIKFTLYIGNLISLISKKNEK